MGVGSGNGGRRGQMQRKRTWQTLKCTAASLVMVGLSGCPEPHSKSPNILSTKALPVSQTESDAATEDRTEPQPVNFEVCGELPSWQRPEPEIQTAELSKHPRYSNGLEEAPLKDLSERFWRESVITFTTYGLSARLEPIYLTGVWTAIDTMAACYEGDRPNNINQGQLAEVWLIGYQVTRLQWSGEHYQIMVEPTPQGLKFIQFQRFETNTTLPIVVQEANGAEVETTSGDW